ncbi:MAG: GNAT family N-acetyltransferase [Gammaproteobacteria bacterium]|nr:MAG: GNAT family N-acetyltransferase [Gammaproteobacteria bacterium]
MVLIERVRPSDPGFQQLMAELDAYQSQLYSPESNFLDSVEALEQADACVLVAIVGGETVGCGAMKIIGGYAELKRMYVSSGHRRHGVATALLEWLEREIASAGVPCACLETGVHQPGALSFYARHGYLRRGPFGDYRADPLSVFLEKDMPGVGPE